MPRDVDVVLKSRALEGRKVLLGISGGIAVVVALLDWPENFEGMEPRYM